MYAKTKSLLVTVFVTLIFLILLSTPISIQLGCKIISIVADASALYEVALPEPHILLELGSVLGSTLGFAGLYFAFKKKKR